MKNKYAILFSISNSYSFTLCNVLMSLSRNSPRCVENCDIIIYSNDLTENNKNIIQKINNNCKFFKIVTSENNEDFIKNHTLPKFFLEYPAVKTRWGIWNLFKLTAYTFLYEYEKILILDADIYINKDIYSIFNIKLPLAWRKVEILNAVDELKKVNLYYKNIDVTLCCGGVVLITKKILEYCSLIESIKLFKELTKNEDIKLIDEIFHTWISYRYEIPVELLSELWNGFKINKIKEIKIIHFWGNEIAPWKNVETLKLFPEWLMYHRRIQELGVDSIPNFNFK